MSRDVETGHRTATRSPVRESGRLPGLRHDRWRGRAGIVAAGGAVAIGAGLALTQQLPAWLVAPQYADEVAGALVGAIVGWGAYRLHRRAGHVPRPPRPDA